MHYAVRYKQIKNNLFCFIYVQNSLSLQRCRFAFMQLKGNQVKVLNSRATVSVQFCLISIAVIREKGDRALLRKSGDLLKASSFFQHVIGNGVVIYFYVFYTRQVTTCLSFLHSICTEEARSPGNSPFRIPYPLQESIISNAKEFFYV